MRIRWYLFTVLVGLALLVEPPAGHGATVAADPVGQGVAHTPQIPCSAASVVFDPVRQGVVHTPQTPGSNPPGPAMNNQLPPLIVPFDPRQTIVFPSNPSWYPVGYSDQPNFGYDVPIQSVPRTAADDRQVDPDYVRGRAWGQDLRRAVASWEKFVVYCKEYILPATTDTRESFQRGFVEAYGTNANEAWQKALGQAQALAAAPPSPATVPPPPATVVSPYGVVESH